MKSAPKRKASIKVEHGSGNVFADLGLPDAEELLAKAELAIVISHIIQDNGWTQRYAAAQLGVAPPDVSDLMRGKFFRFSQERLERFLNKLDYDVHIQVAPRPKGTRRDARVTVERVGPYTAKAVAVHERIMQKRDPAFRSLAK